MTESMKNLQATAVNFNQLYDLDQLRPGEQFELTWGFRNDGDTAWEDVILVYTDESFPETIDHAHTNLAEKAEYQLAELGAGKRIVPGDTAYISVQMFAPEAAGSYVTGWQLKTAESNRFGPIREMRIIVVDSGEKSLTGLKYDATFKNYAPNYFNLKPGEQFKGVWTLVNEGIDSWSGNFRVAYHTNTVSQNWDAVNDSMGVKETRSLYECTGKRTVEPDDTVAIPFNFTAPQTPNIYAFHWHMLDESGQPFGGTRWMRVAVKQQAGTAPSPSPSPSPATGTPSPVPHSPVNTGNSTYQGKAVTFFTGIHGPADDWMWGNAAFQNKMKALNMPVFFWSQGANGDYAHFGDKTKNAIRLYWNPRAVSAEEAYKEVRDDQLKKWWDRGYRRFIFFNEPQFGKEIAKIEEGMGISWHNKTEFAAFLGKCLRLAKADYPDIQLFTTPMSSNDAFDPWGWRDEMWAQVKGVVDGWCMHAYSGDNVNAEAAAQNIADQVVALQRRYQLQIPIIISEASVNRGSDAEQKARVAHLLHKKLSKIAGVEGLFWYAADWKPEYDSHKEGWFRNGIADAYIRQRNNA